MRTCFYGFVFSALFVSNLFAGNELEKFDSYTCKSQSDKSEESLILRSRFEREKWVYDLSYHFKRSDQKLEVNETIATGVSCRAVLKKNLVLCLYQKPYKALFPPPSVNVDASLQYPRDLKLENSKVVSKIFVGPDLRFHGAQRENALKPLDRAVKGGARAIRSDSIEAFREKTKSKLLWQFEETQCRFQ